MKNCQYGFRNNGDVSVHCQVLKDRGERSDYCVFQYHCNRSRKWEISEKGRTCMVHKKKL